MRSVGTLVAACALLLVSAVSASAQQTVFVVRHAERADAVPAGTAPMTAPRTDPPLSAAGHERAARLATMLRSADIKQIFTTEFVRTKQTAEPTAQALKLNIGSISSKDLDALILRVTSAQANVLVVGHSNTVPDILKRLGVKDVVTIADTEFDNLFVVVRPAAGDPALIRLRY
jgi:broad specificity phosphatase PhoE